MEAGVMRWDSACVHLDGVGIGVKVTISLHVYTNSPLCTKQLV